MPVLVYNDPRLDHHLANDDEGADDNAGRLKRHKPARLQGGCSESAQHLATGRHT